MMLLFKIWSVQNDNTLVGYGPICQPLRLVL